MTNSSLQKNIGTVVSVHGSVVDIHFNDSLPAIATLLRAGNAGEIAIEVLAQLDRHRVRGIALTPHPGAGSRHDRGRYRRSPHGSHRRRNSLAHV